MGAGAAALSFPKDTSEARFGRVLVGALEGTLEASFGGDDGPLPWQRRALD
jgi:hypothetical protein